MLEGHVELIRKRREAAELRAAEARRRAGLARFHEANANDPVAAERYAAEAVTHERAVELQEQAAANQREHELHEQM
jgi:hypothetical protein